MKRKIDPGVAIVSALGIIGLAIGGWMVAEGKELYLSLYPNGLEVGLADQGINKANFENRPELEPDGIFFGTDMDAESADGNKIYHAEGIQFNGISRWFGWRK